jgi:hypothetical protein
MTVDALGDFCTRCDVLRSRAAGESVGGVGAGGYGLGAPV